jgi:RimJ/RimL family protein N-acetyltransferase
MYRGRLSLRPAAPDDLERTFAWAIDPGTRAGSFDTRPIDRQAHEAWFARALEGERRLFIAELDGRAVGLFRLDPPPDETADAEVGITVAPDARGAGLAPAILEAGARLGRDLGATRLLAQIRADNGASIHAFERAAYECDGEIIHKGVQALVYRRSSE